MTKLSTLCWCVLLLLVSLFALKSQTTNDVQSEAFYLRVLSARVQLMQQQQKKSLISIFCPKICVNVHISGQTLTKILCI